MEDETQIKKIYSEMYKNMISKDIYQLGKLLDDSFILIHMTGMRQSKKEYLEAIKNGTLNYFSEEADHICIKTTGEYASLIGQSRVDAAVFGSGRNTWKLELNINLIKKNGQWIITEIRASTY